MSCMRCWLHPRSGKKLAPCYPGVEFDTQCHPMATGLVLLHDRKGRAYRGGVWSVTPPIGKIAQFAGQLNLFAGL